MPKVTLVFPALLLSCSFETFFSPPFLTGMISLNLSSFCVSVSAAIPLCMAHYFIVLRRYRIFFFFNKLQVCGNAVSIGAIFPIAFARFVCLCHIW